MIKQVVFGLVASAVLAMASGCGVVHALLFEPFGPGVRRVPCDGGVCGEACEEGCGPGCAHRPIRNAIAARHGCVVGEACGDECGEGCVGGCGGCCERGPLTWLFSLLRCDGYPCNGCGQRYWGEWANDRPDCCDSCDSYGNHTQHAPETVLPPRPASATPAPAVPNPPQYRQDGTSKQSARTTRTTHPTRQYTKSQPNYAPRVISVKDEVVVPAEASESVPRVAQPRRVSAPQ